MKDNNITLICIGFMLYFHFKDIFDKQGFNTVGKLTGSAANDVSPPNNIQLTKLRKI